MGNTAKLIVSILIAQAAGVIGSLATTSAIPTWYQSLNKPSFNPPNWIFGPVWITLYALMGIASWLIWKSKKSKNRKKALKIYFTQLVFNAAWSILFFGLKNPQIAFFEILILIYLIALTIKSFYKISKSAAWMLVPYLAWVSFATYLNYSIWQLNK